MKENKTNSPIAAGKNTRSFQKNARLLIGSFLLCIFSLYLSIAAGGEIGAADIVQALIKNDPTDSAYKIFMYVRLPRTIAALACGMSLAAAGVLTQAALNNAMASPNIIGVNSGAGFFVMLCAALFPNITKSTAAFCGALSATLLIYLLSEASGISRTSLILSGLAVNGILNAAMNALKLLFPESISSGGGFLAGSLSGVNLIDVTGALYYIIPGIIIALGLAYNLNIMQLGQESASSLGLNVRLTGLSAVLAASMLSGAAVSFAGLVGFVGLLAPHAARKLVGGDNRVLIPQAMLLGAALVLLSDTAARVLFYPYELPVGIILSFFGGIFFLVLLIRGKRRKIYDQA